ncbi:MAG: diguanylate cyclase [Pseudomonadota bacterium]
MRPTTILLAEPEPAAMEKAIRALRQTGCVVVQAVDGQDALEKAQAESPDLAILELSMPRLGGIEVLSAIKKEAARGGRFVPVIVLSASADSATCVSVLRAGAEDFVGKPYNAEELRARVEVLLRTKRLVDETARGRAELEEASQHDRLTGLHNHRYLVQRLAEEFRRAAQKNELLAVMAVDLDELRRINSKLGREAGDRLLVRCARTLAQSCREGDVVTRASDDEFVVVLPNTHFAGSMVIAERVWRDVRGAAVIEEDGSRTACEVSIGVACYPSRDVTSARDLLRFAHAALARAKAEGRGKVCLYQHQGYLLQTH